MKIVIFGAGVAGLSCAHELIRAGHTVSIYEAEPECGGMARTIETEKGVVVERSWRGINTKMYKNVLHIFNDLGIKESDLSNKIKFVHFKDDGELTEMWSKKDLYELSKILVPVMMDPTNDKYYEMNIEHELKGKLSEGGYNRVIRMLCPGLGLKQSDTSVGHLASLISAVAPYEIYGGHKWTSTTLPTSEFWFDPWILDLKRRGVDIYVGKKLEHVEYDGDIITGCTVDGKAVSADMYVMAMSPYHTYDIIKHIDSDHVRTLGELASHEPTTEISFQIGFDIQLEYEEKTSVMSFPDSEFNLTVADQSLFWKKKDLGKTKSLWSCVACNVPDHTITEDQFIKKMYRLHVRQQSPSKDGRSRKFKKTYNLDQTVAHLGFRPRRQSTSKSESTLGQYNQGSQA